MRDDRGFMKAVIVFIILERQMLLLILIIYNLQYLFCNLYDLTVESIPLQNSKNPLQPSVE